MNEPTTDRPVATVTVLHHGLGDHGWQVTIDGHELSGGCDDLRNAQSALHNIPESGGIAVVAGCGSLPVPHQSAGRVAAMALADLSMVPAGDTVTLTVKAGDDPCEI